MKFQGMTVQAAADFVKANRVVGDVFGIRLSLCGRWALVDFGLASTGVWKDGKCQAVCPDGRHALQFIKRAAGRA